jgi:hypothetical protein
MRHAGGDDRDGCIACWMEGSLDLAISPDDPSPSPCTEPTDDGEGYCAVCGHAVAPR